MHKYLTNYICSYVCMIHYITVRYSTEQYSTTNNTSVQRRSMYLYRIIQVEAYHVTLVGRDTELYPSYMHDTTGSEHIRAFEAVTWTNHLQCLSQPPHANGKHRQSRVVVISPPRH